MEIEQNDILLCTVDKVTKTNVFVKINGTKREGSIIMSEIAPGRIRNIRDYVVPKKTIICKVLNITPNNIQLSLRRVKEKERKEIIEQNKTEKSYRSILKSVLKEKTPEIVGKITEENTLYIFLEAAKEDSKELEKLTGKEDAQKILEILNTQKKKTIVLKKEIKLTTTNHNGLTLIKELLENNKDVEIKYIAAGKYSIKREDSDIKKAAMKIKEVVDSIEKAAKKYNIEITYKQ